MDWSIAKFYKIFREDIMSILFKLFNKMKRSIFPRSFLEAKITVIPKPDKDSTKKVNHRPVSLKNIDAEFLKKPLAHRIQQIIKEIIYHTQVSFTLGMQEKLSIHKSVNIIYHINRNMYKSYMITSVNI